MESERPWSIMNEKEVNIIILTMPFHSINYNSRTLYLDYKHEIVLISFILHLFASIKCEPDKG